MAQSIHAHTFYRANPFCTCTTALISQSVKTLFDKPVQCVRNLQGDRGVATTALSCGCSWCCLPVLYCWYYCCDCRCSGCCCCSCYYFFFVLLLLVLVLVLLQLQLLLLRQRQQQLLLLVAKTTTATIRLPLQLPPTTSCGDDCVRDFTFSPWMPTIGLTVQQRHHKFALKQHFHLYHARNSRVV